MTRRLRYILGWVLVLIGAGLTHLSTFLIRIGAVAMDREDRSEERRVGKECRL